MMSWIIGHIFAALIGVSLGLIGGGGSILAVPILVYVMGVEPKSAIAMSLAIVGTVSLLGVIPHWKLGNVNLKKAAIFGSATMVGAYGGARLANMPFISGTMQLLLFAVLMLVAAGFMIRKGSKPPAPKTTQSEVTNHPDSESTLTKSSDSANDAVQLGLLLAEGLGVGILTGLVGVGGGFAIVPALVLLGKTPMKEAVGTSLVIIVANSVTAFLGYLQSDIPLNWQLIASFIVAASLGIAGGAYISRFVQAKQLQKWFGFFLLAMAAFILFQNRSAFTRPTKAEVVNRTAKWELTTQNAPFTSKRSSGV
ncbi:sulfite exporter TauE/SafE family protein [Phormidium sp. CCY1219]|uniref:sulfite exporter TauE/SafE family protein n=1 Tax=Phormidium sp. CCY1219 TaxID=2886104 RepID=UPI002D1F01F9|nr:sulfite exporter TauE/SafE family protein [Phormidium sp. CCY1219]MEB3831662.1 sulfite exporter TauE/SafE family protein [Phormidium sp. CCY1219]